MDSASDERMLWIMSDSTGETAHHVAEACIEQFEHAHIRVQRMRHIRTAAQVTQAMHAAADSKAIVFYTFVNVNLRRVAKDSAEHFGVIAVDIIGDALEGMGRWLDKTPRHKPGRVLDKQYFERVAARDFAQQHDDGQRPEDLPNADVIIIGMSRTGKTPLMHVLAEYGLRVANVPLVPGVPPPEQLFLADPKRVFVLKMQPERLRLIRMQRLSKLGVGADDPYVDLRAIAAELRTVETLVSSNPHWRVIDMTKRAIEEAAGEVLQFVGPVAI